MEQNPIKYSDLISPDDSIEKLIGQLEQLNEAYSGMATSIRSQAYGLSQSLRTVSGATAEGQKKTREAATDADRLAKAYRDLDIALSENAKEIAKLNVLKREQNNMNKMLVLRGKEEIQTQEQIKNATYQQLSAQYSLNKAYLNNISAVERENKENKKLVETTKAIYEQMKRLQEETGKYQLNVGNYENAITNAIGVNTRWYQGIKDIGMMFEGGFAKGVEKAGSAIGALGKKFLALMANPIVAAIAAIAAAFMGLAKGISTSEQNTMALQRVLAPFERILTGIVSVLQDTAGWILKGVEGMEKFAMALSRSLERLPLVGNALKNVNNELQKNINLTMQKQQLELNERQNTIEQARLQRDIAKFRQAAEQTSDPKRRVMLLKMADTQERQMLYNEMKLAKENLRIQEEKAKQSQNDKKVNDDLAAARVRMYKAEENYYTRTTRLMSKIRTNQEKMNKGAGGGGAASGKGTSEAEQAAKTALEERRKIEDARIALIEDANVRERATIIMHYNRQIEDVREKYGKESELIVLLEQEKEQKLADLFEKQAKQQQEREKKASDERIKALKEQEQRREQAVREAERAINNQYDLAVSYADLENAENKKTELRLKAEKERLQKLLALYEKDGKTLTEAEVQILKNNMSQVDKEITENRKGRDIYDMLGFNMTDEQKQAISDSFAYAVEQLNGYMQAWVEAANKKLEYAQKEVDSTKSALDKEIEARNNGYAANVALAQKEYDQARKNQQKALREQQRAQKAQQMIDTATQVSSLITATANIWKAFTGTGPWGIAAAVAATALMFGSFAAAKIKAASVSRSSGDEEYGEGTVELLQGGSHQSGNDIDLGRKKDGTRRRAEGGEYFAVINKRNSRRYRDLIPQVIGALNDGTFAQKYQRAYADGGLQVSVQTQGQDLRGLTSDVQRIREQGEQRVSYDRNGNEVIQYKNLRRIIKGN